jgi:hypothetical protein
MPARVSRSGGDVREGALERGRPHPRGRAALERGGPHPRGHSALERGRPRSRGRSVVPPWRAARAASVVIVSCTCFRFMS